MAIVKKDGVVVSTDATSPFSLQNLTPNTKYTVEVVEELATGTIEFTTTDIVPNAPTITVVAKPGAIDFTIVQGTNDGSALTGYKVYYTDGTTTKTFDTVSLRGTLTGLTDGKQYSVQATMINQKGESVKSATVTATPTTPVASVSVTPITATLDVGATMTASATVLPTNATNKNVTWTTNMSTVARVVSTTGVVTGVKAGTATITATASNKTATTTVTVVDPVG